MTRAPGKIPEQATLEGLFGPDGCFAPAFIRWLEDQEDCVFLETARPSRTERFSYVFLEPVSRIECWSLDQVEEGLRAVERVLDQGLYAAGFLSYELGYAFEKGGRLEAAPSTPLLWMGVYREPWIYDHANERFEQGREAARVCALNALAAAQALIGDLEQVRVIRAVGYVASTPEFTQQPAVVNGASELLRDVLGEERGVGTRLALGVTSLPANSPVEFEVILETG